ncbi:MAG: hypothetical protein Q7W51_06475 [Coriobacteriia bacterium]|nr:hypothetical protein [Coriobacteriia bacterium]
MGTVATTNAFLTWFAEWGQVAYVGIQMAFWTAIAVAALIIALQYKKYVTYKVGGKNAPSADAAVYADASPEVEAFVE